FTGEGGTGVLTAKFIVCSPKAAREPGTCESKGETAEELTVSVECTSEFNHGETAGSNKVANVSVIFRGCVALGSISCSNTPNEGEIQVNPLKGQLGIINKAKKEVGVLLEPQQKKGAFARFSCGGILTTTVGVGNAKEGAAYSPEKTGGGDGIISPI